MLFAAWLFQLSRKMTINVAVGATMTPGVSAPDHDLYLYNSTGATLSSSENGSGAVESVLVRNTGASSATYYVGVRYYSGATGATNGKYTLQLIW